MTAIPVLTNRWMSKSGWATAKPTVQMNLNWVVSVETNLYIGTSVVIHGQSLGRTLPLVVATADTCPKTNPKNHIYKLTTFYISTLKKKKKKRDFFGEKKKKKLTTKTCVCQITTRMWGSFHVSDRVRGRCRSNVIAFLPTAHVKITKKRGFPLYYPKCPSMLQ